MPRLKPLAAALAALLVTPLPALANAELEKLRTEFEQKLKAVQENYETRLKEIEGRMTNTEGVDAFDFIANRVQNRRPSARWARHTTFVSETKFSNRHLG